MFPVAVPFSATVFTAGAVAATPFTVEVMVLTGFANVLVDAGIVTRKPAAEEVSALPATGSILVLTTQGVAVEPLPVTMTELLPVREYKSINDDMLTLKAVPLLRVNDKTLVAALKLAADRNCSSGRFMTLETPSSLVKVSAPVVPL